MGKCETRIGFEDEILIYIGQKVYNRLEYMMNQNMTPSRAAFENALKNLSRLCKNSESLTEIQRRIIFEYVQLIEATLKYCQI